MAGVRAYRAPFDFHLPADILEGLSWDFGCVGGNDDDTMCGSTGAGPAAATLSCSFYA